LVPSALVPATLGIAIPSFICIVIWYELVAPYRVVRTVPRFKKL
jgi:hypothetical protein